ncbi:ATP-dependent DNA helicase [Campylobacter fetus]|uniref:ATP-dependent DNA helicase n=1 Tax=Campylobacter fetus TaxID=196 RepID=UPI0003C29B39|nr:DEAD/DEAH box helicase [Campylobacter fetus]AGZ81460.1 putative helicase, PIF1 family (DUF889 domain) [Campylobacter fetus subsp. testudinum 03-427]EAI4322472.1 AAA family ATPase [Campylobacter fetus]EAI4391882.1 AAA family ATPase [Campylobacter fetus]OCS06366.1 ATPase AAA [Campylobacter fetus subsp. testudinum]OCS07730.1 ATPase AAA [Campylobacter fetus subsp. testudinum]
MLNDILNILNDSNLFLTGGGGVGKSYTIKEIISHYKSGFKNVVVLGSTGISAVGVGGVSCHSFFKFGISENFEELKLLDKKQKSKLNELKKILKNCDLLIIDEISMVSAELMEMISLRLIWSEFRGKVLLVGDFYQLPPVKKSAQNLLFSFNYAFSSNAWNNLNLKNVELRVSKRTKDVGFYKILSKIRIGVIDDEICDFLKSKIVREIPNNITALFGRNYEADRLNEQRLNEINSSLETILAKTKIYDNSMHSALLQKWILNLNSPCELRLKKGAKVMFLANKWGEYYNGEQGVIREFVKGEGGVEIILVQKDSGEVIRVEPHTYELYDYHMKDEELSQTLKANYMQFPLKLAYAITIHKSQGMSIEKFACNVDNIFANGQLYVALSRAISADGLYIQYTKNIDFADYLKKVVKIDNEVSDFYRNSKFIKENIT